MTQIMQDKKQGSARPLVSADLLKLGLVALAWAVLYFDVIRRLVDDWLVDENYSHGLILPFVSVYAVWRSRHDLSKIPAEPKVVSGLLLLAIALLMLFAGIVGAELYVTRISMLLSLASLVIYFFGYLWLRLLLFPIGLMILAIPVPNIVFNQVAFPMQLMASDYAALVIRSFGIPALREGNIIELASMKLQVVEACSGIRSLMALTSVCVVYVYFVEQSWWRRIVLIAAVFPIAVFTNALRVALTGLIANYRGPAYAEGFMHSFSGWLVFTLAVVMLIILHRILKIKIVKMVKH
ncbi:MAG: exosortase [Acidobacteria bacterium]|nr:exosortase [Acidobacteriota bacterium]